MDLGELVLSELELEVLRSHALLAPGYVMSASDLAGSLEIRRSQASQLLAKLEKLALLQRGFSTDEGESGYRLSGSGHFVLMARGQRDEGR
jgi:predicted transcriptional regulator